MGPVLTASLVACIALWFPNLKELSFAGSPRTVVPETNAAQLTAIIRGGLDRLPQLVKLTLPSWGLLGGLGEVQQRRHAYDSGGSAWLGNLQQLVIVATRSELVTDAIAAGIASLRSLRALRFINDPLTGDALDEAGLLRLFDHVPPSLTTLSILSWSMDAVFEAGQLKEVALVVDEEDMFRSIPLWKVGEVADKALLPHLRAKDSMLRRLVVRRLLLPATEHDARIQATDQQLDAITELLKRCWNVEVQEVMIRGTTSHLPALMEAAELLGPPQVLRLRTIYNYDLRVPLLQPATPAGQEAKRPGRGAAAEGTRTGPGDSSLAQQPLQQPQEQQPQVQQPPSGLPLALSTPPQAVVARGVHRLLAHPQIEPPIADESMPTSRTARLLVLRGSLVAGLAQVPEVVDGWVKWLAKTAAAPAKRRHGQYQVVPRVLGGPVLLLQADGEAGAAAALQAAVRSVEPEVQLDAAWVAVERYPGCPGFLKLPAPLVWCIQQELDESWAAAGSGRGGSAGAGAAGTGAGGHAAAVVPPSLQEQVEWLQQLGKVLAEELPSCKHFSF
ncbi:hypothetical protein CHLRE_10g450150v5 [Chlamydomonas reinhardtii]|uniref:Uncharacterized protein n=1 Tax=Chlamydomonas reinhardtii TaxID=3055 RepID=A0A2K3DB51_CHLRE|nr:uncharacterized protein CHLRE_10g450150v5 [Chlamydomonas reinhardtii]PNW77751.1 hypothetical protein CHLRE_10g450150v5 [Chlamydomonas reinhardtii]